MTVTQLERMAKVEAGIDYLKKEMDEMKDMLKTHVEWEEVKYRDMKETFASKWTEKVLLGVLITITAALIGAFMKVILI